MTNTAINNPNVIYTSTPSITLSSNCNLFSLPPKAAPSNYTSQGKRKAHRSEAITNPEDIDRIKNFYLTTGHKKNRFRNYMIFILGTSIGLRGCDLLRLQIGDILNPDGTIKNRIATFESKTSKMNYPYINDIAKQAICQYLNSLSSFSLDDYLITNLSTTDNTPLDSDSLYKLILKAKNALNLPYHMGEHTLRKTFAYWTIRLHPDNTEVMITLQEMLNHSSMRTTLRYAGITDNDYRNMYNDIGNFITNPSCNNQPCDISFDKNINKIVDELVIE